MSDSQTKALLLHPAAPAVKLLRERTGSVSSMGAMTSKNIFCRVVGCREAKLTPSNPRQDASPRQPWRFTPSFILSSKHGITEIDYHRLKKPRLSIQRALVNESRQSPNESINLGNISNCWFRKFHWRCTFGTIRPGIGSLDYWVHVTAEYTGRSSIPNSY
jgi:hypothetical protein